MDKFDIDMGNKAPHPVLDQATFVPTMNYPAHPVLDQATMHSTVNYQTEAPIEEVTFTAKFTNVCEEINVDGGSTPDIYRIIITNEAGESIAVETGDIIRCLVGNDFYLGNIIKACRRMYLAAQGRGKSGTSMAYDANKINYFSGQFLKFFNK